MKVSAFSNLNIRNDSSCYIQLNLFSQKKMNAATTLKQPVVEERKREVVIMCCHCMYRISAMAIITPVVKREKLLNSIDLFRSQFLFYVTFLC